MTDQTVTLATPIIEGDNKIETITLRKPKAGELRGIKLTDLMQIDIAAYEKLLPRITSPVLIAQQVAQLELSDIADIATVINGFFEKARPTM